MPHRAVRGGLSLFMLIFLAGACAGGASAPSVGSAIGDGSAEAIADTLAASGLECTDLTSRSGASNVADEVRCSIGDDDVIIRTFMNAEDRDRFIAASGEVVGQLSLSVDAPPRLVGPTWIVTTDSLATAERVRAILGGELR